MRQETRRGWNERGWGIPAVALTLFCALLAAALFTSRASGAPSDGCTNACVILIQVDGLEPKDVTQQSTPYLWQLAHPKFQNTSVPSPALDGRAGWIWQAPRGVVSSGTASATASLLAGGYPEMTATPADDFWFRSKDNVPTHQRFGAGLYGDSPDSRAGGDVAEPVDTSQTDTLMSAANKSGTGAAVFLGDAGLAKLTGAVGQNPHWYPPGLKDNAGNDSATYGDQQFTGDPRLCPVPRYPDAGQTQPSQDSQALFTANLDPPRCPANDLTVVHKAFSDLQQPGSAQVRFTFLHLAELGVAKRLSGDPRIDLRRTVGDKTLPPPPDVPQALTDLDAAIATFVERYAQDGKLGAKWKQTVLMVVGDHGYQATPLANRVPDPNSTDARRDLSDYVSGFPGSNGSLTLVPQGTMATVYYGMGNTAPAGRDATLQALKVGIESQVNTACRTGRPDLGDCVRGVYYVDKGTPNTGDTLDAKHPSWHLDAQDLGTHRRTGASGDLVVELQPGWAAGRAVGSPYAGGAPDPRPFTNPYTGSAGGPRERAVAALVNGPSSTVRNLDNLAPGGVKYFPVSKATVDPSDENNPPPVTPATQKCLDTATDPGGLTCANDPANVGDDATKAGHEAQPVTVDFALTISALMKIPFESHPDQLQGRVLQEAFTSKLKPPCVSDCEPPPPPRCGDVAANTMSNQSVPVGLSCTDEAGAPLTYRVVSGPAHGTLGVIDNGIVTYTPAPGFADTDTFTYQATSKNGTSDVATATIFVIAPPVFTQEEGFNFHGLMRDLKALVVNGRDLPYARASRGSVMSTIRLEGDFGKPETAVALTFYRRVTGAARSAGVVRLKAIARFDPFVVQRGHVSMRLKVPPQFSPNYVGVTVREIAMTGSRRRMVGGVPCTTLKTLKPMPFRCTGPSAGKILAIADADRLHKPKAGGPAPRRRR